MQRKGERRRASPKVLVAAALAGLVLAGTAVGIATAVGNKSSPPVPTATRGSLATGLPGAAEVQRLFVGIPQHGNVLGSPRARATMIEYVDPQCPYCREFESAVMPDIIRRFVRTGKLKIEARTIAFIGQDSLRGRDAALAAGQQGRLFNFMQLLYFNQGTENSGWLSSDFVKRVAVSIPGLDVPRLTGAAGSAAVLSQANRLEAEATADRVSGTPTVYVGRTGSKPKVVALQSPDDERTLVTAIQRAGG
ncbi:MAG TPA: thioredoxin domain-containing protein [Gaiellaceae bacterium]